MTPPSATNKANTCQSLFYCMQLLSLTVCSCCPSLLSHALAVVLSVTVALFTLQFTVNGLNGPVGVSVAESVMEENGLGQGRR